MEDTRKHYWFTMMDRIWNEVEEYKKRYNLTKEEAWAGVYQIAD